MKNHLQIMLSIGLTICCWGVYGPLLRHGGDAMGESTWRPFACVGFAYFIIAVLLPALWLKSTTGIGPWTHQATAWNAGAGIAGSFGALGVILALAQGGSPLFVMPLVFGGAPVVNSILTIRLTKSRRNSHPMLLAGLLMVLAGAVMVIVFNPASLKSAAISSSVTSVPDKFGIVEGSCICWHHRNLLGCLWTDPSQGPIVNAGRSISGFLRVGLAYFIVASILPLLFLTGSYDRGQFTFGGTLWSVAGGVAGALGSFGIIRAFTYGATPVYVMPLAFGGAPIVNTLITVLTRGSASLPTAPFFVGLIVVAGGAVIVLAFAPVNTPSKQRSQPGGTVS